MSAITQKNIDRDAMGKVYNIYDRKEIPADSNHSINQFISIDELLRHHIIINDKHVIGTLFISSDRRFYVISLPQVGMDGQVYGTIGTSPTQYVPIKLPPNNLRDIITRIDCEDSDDLSLYKVESINLEESTLALFTITKNSKLMQVPRIIPLPGYYGIDGGVLDDKKVRDSISKLHPAIPGWLKACDGWLDSSRKDENVQVLSARKLHYFNDLAPDGSFILHYITELDARDKENHPIYDIDKQLVGIATKNCEEYFKIFPKHKPIPMINVSSNNTAIELLNNDDPIDKDEKL